MIMVAIGFWSLGFIQGNAAGSRRIGIAAFMTHSATLKRFEDGNLDWARAYSAMFVENGDKYLHSDPFWWVALEEAFTVDNEGMFERQLPHARDRVKWVSSAPPIQAEGEKSTGDNEER